MSKNLTARIVEGSHAEVEVNGWKVSVCPSDHPGLPPLLVVVTKRDFGATTNKDIYWNPANIVDPENAVGIDFMEVLA